MPEGYALKMNCSLGFSFRVRRDLPEGTWDEMVDNEIFQEKVSRNVTMERRKRQAEIPETPAQDNNK